MLRHFETEEALHADFERGVANRRNWNPKRVKLGRFGQITLCEMFNAPLEMTNDRERGDGAIDLDVELRWRGLTEWVICDAKCTEYERRGRYFFVNAGQVYPEHIYIAMLLNNSVAEPTGWVWGYELLDDDRRWKLRGYKDDDSECYHCPRGIPPMHAMPELLEMFTGNTRPTTEERRKNRYDWRLFPRNQRERDHPLTGQETALSRR